MLRSETTDFQLPGVARRLIGCEELPHRMIEIRCYDHRPWVIAQLLDSGFRDLHVEPSFATIKIKSEAPSGLGAQAAPSRLIERDGILDEINPITKVGREESCKLDEPLGIETGIEIEPDRKSRVRLSESRDPLRLGFDIGTTLQFRVAETGRWLAVADDQPVALGDHQPIEK